MTAVQLAAVARLYSPSAESLRRDLPEIGECIRAQLLELHREPTPERVDVLLIAVEGIRRHLARYRERLVAEGEQA